MLHSEIDAELRISLNWQVMLELPCFKTREFPIQDLAGSVIVVAVIVVAEGRPASLGLVMAWPRKANGLSSSTVTRAWAERC